jgi:hypothetical protein
MGRVNVRKGRLSKGRKSIRNQEKGVREAIKHEETRRWQRKVVNSLQ